jgi:hypothetical protein
MSYIYWYSENKVELLLVKIIIGVVVFVILPAVIIFNWCGVVVILILLF